MRTKIKHVSELPDWFQLEKYENTKDLNALGWYQQIDVRFCIETCGTHNDYIYDEPDEDDFYYEELLTIIRDNPVIDIHNDIRWKEFTGIFQFSKLVPSNNFYAQGIRPLTAFDYVLIGSFICQDKLKTMQKWWNQSYFKNNDTEENLTMPDCNTVSMYELSHLNGYSDEFWDALMVDLVLPDNVLIEDFKNYLKNRRAGMTDEIENIDFYSKSNFDSWYRSGVLPYIDLRMWAREKNVVIPYRVMADAIFPSGVRGEETIRKTTKPLAEMLLTEASRTQLASRAMTEIAEKKSK